MKKETKKIGKAAFSFVDEFKKFISKGSILDMAVGVIIGGAFNKIVSSLVGILLSVCTWGVPGGLKGLITVLPAANKAQQPMKGLASTFDKQNMVEFISDYAKTIAPAGTDVSYGSAAYNAAAKDITANYVLHGNTYVYKQLAVIDWGTFINAVITFFIIALTLFFIVKGIKKIRERNEAKINELKNELNEEELKAKAKADAEAKEKAEKEKALADAKAAKEAEAKALLVKEQKERDEKQIKLLNDILVELKSSK